MRILHLINYYQPKIGYQEFFLAQKQKELGHEVFFITSDRYFPFKNYKDSYRELLGPRKIQAGKFIEQDITVYRLKPFIEIVLTFIENPYIFIKGVVPLIKKISPEVIICHGTTIPLSIQLARTNFRGRKPFIIYDDHQGYPAKNKVWMHKLYGKMFSHYYLNLILKTKDRIVATSEHTKQTLVDNFGFPRGQIITVPVGVDTKAFYFSKEARNEIRNELNLRKDDILCIYAGKISHHKGISELLITINKLRKKYDNFFLLLIGFIQDDEILKDIHSMNGIKYCNSVQNKYLYKYFSAADFAIWPKHITISHYEAMACQLPIIVSSLDVAKERIYWGNGYSLESSTVDEIYEKCELMITNEPMRERMGKRALKAIKEELCWDVIVKFFLP